MNEFRQNRGLGILMLARMTVEATSAYFVTAALLHYGAVSTAVGQCIIQAQPEVAVASLSLLVLAIWLVVTLVFGRVFCSTLCPLGALLDVMGRMRPSGKPFRFVRGSVSLRLSFLALAGVLMIVLRPDSPPPFFPESFYAMLVEAFAHPQVGWTVAVCVTLTIALAVGAMRRGRLVCNTLCPVGTVLGLLARRSAFRIDINTDRCIQCRRCSDVCKSECIDLQDHVVDMSRCVVCFNCLPQCPNEAISYTPGRHVLSTPMLIKTSTQYKATQDKTTQYKTSNFTESNETIS